MGITRMFLRNYARQQTRQRMALNDCRPSGYKQGRPSFNVLFAREWGMLKAERAGKNLRSFRGSIVRDNFQKWMEI